MAVSERTLTPASPAPTSATPPAPAAPVAARPRRLRGRQRGVLGIARRQKAGSFGLVIALLVLLSAIFAPLLAPSDPVALNLVARLKPPGSAFLLGSDTLGRDVLSRLIFGARVSLEVAFISVAMGLTFGVLIGLVSGYYRGKVDAAVMRVVDVLISIPALILALSVAAAFGQSVSSMMLAIGVTFVPVVARVTRATVLSLREQEFVSGARSLGATDARIIARHILPNALSPVIVLATLLMAQAILIESSLSFIGLGVPPPTPTWGTMLDEGRSHLRDGPWLSWFAGVAIMLTVLAFNLIGDGLRDLLDPRLRRTL